MSEDYKVQVNLKVGETLINLRANTVDDAVSQVNAARESLLDAVGEAMSIAKQVVTAKGLTSFQPAPAAATTASTQHTAPAAGATSGALRCKHGAYKDFNGKTKKNGDGYQYRYYCAAPFKQGGNPDQCKAQDLPGQEAWSA